MTDIKEARDLLAGAELIYSAEAVAEAVSRVAAEITAKLGDSNPLLLCVMSGGVPFAGQLMTQLLFP
ncbi:MAG: phosphoribosyltransferase family protein, partial [Propionivibrio sp.]